MPKPAQNILTITPLNDGRFFLSGYAGGKQTRRKFTDITAAEETKKQLEHDAIQESLLEATKPIPQYTRLSAEQIREAENLFAEFGKLARPVAEYARAGLGVLGAGEMILCTAALEQWRVHQLREEKLDEGTTVDRNQRILTGFFKDSGVKFVTDINNALIEAFCSLSKIKARDEKHGAKLGSKITRAGCIRAFLNFCVAKKIITASPFEMNMKQLKKLAKGDKERPKVLNPAQCKALLDAALKEYPAFVPYIVLSLWCFPRSSEARRITPEDVKLDRAVPFIEPASNKVNTASYRTTNIPANVLPLLRQCIESGLWAKGSTPYFSVTAFRYLRGAAGLIEFGPYKNKGFRPILSSFWQAHIMRHTGISMFYQHLSDKADTGTFNDKSVIAAVTRQAGNSEGVAFENYINIPDAAQAAEFYKIRGKLTDEAIQRGKEAIATVRDEPAESQEEPEETEAVA